MEKRKRGGLLGSIINRESGDLVREESEREDFLAKEEESSIIDSSSGLSESVVSDEIEEVREGDRRSSRGLLGMLGGSGIQDKFIVEDKSEGISWGEEEEEEVEEEVEEFYNIEKLAVVAGEETDVGGVEREEDSFLEMLESLSDEEDIELARERASLDSGVEVPLVDERAKKAVVTSDGRTLADVLSVSRKGNRTSLDKMRAIENQEEKVEVGGRKYADTRYLKHAERAKKQAEEDEEKIKLSLKFLQKNAKHTEQEKIIMRNLGLSSGKLERVMRSRELTKEEKRDIVSLGRYGAERHFKGRLYRPTVGDSAILEYLAKFKFANTRILRWLKDERQDRTWRKLNRLRDSGLVESKPILGIADLWGCTVPGIGVAGYDHEPGLRPMPKMGTISSNMGVNYLAACLWFNTVNVLNLDDFPAENRVIADQEDGRNRVRGEMLVSEYEIRRSLGREISPTSTTMKTLGDERLYDVISHNVRVEVEDWERGGKVGESPEFALGNEYMWVLYPTSQLTLSYHVPDLVVKRERGENGAPRSIAVEVERHEKSSARYDQIMLAYKLDEHLYEKVIWVTPNTRTARALEKAAREVGFDRYSILPIITKTGVYNKQDIWMI